MKDDLPIIRKMSLVAALAMIFLLPCKSFAKAEEDGNLPPIKGLKLGMPIHEAVAVMNEKAGPIWAATMNKPSAHPYKVMRITGESMRHLRSQLMQLMSLMTMQLHRVDPTDTKDIFIVIPSDGPDTAKDLSQVGIGILQSLFRTGFFAWAGADGSVKLFIIGPSLCNVLFDASSMPMGKFSDQFANAYNIPEWRKYEGAEANRLLTYESPVGPSVALAEDKFGRKTIVVWNHKTEAAVNSGHKKSFD